MGIVRPRLSLPRLPRSEPVDFIEVIHGDERHRVLVRRVARARRLTLRVRAATRDAVLTMPARSSATRARLFVERHAAWIGCRLARLPAATPFVPGAIVPIRGEPHVLLFRPHKRAPISLEPPGATTTPPTLPSLVVAGGDEAFIARRVRDFLMAQARRDLAAAVARHAAALGVSNRRLTIRDTSTRWGSCSSSGALSFSWRLVMAPPDILDYLAAHEVAHLVHMHHRPAFWAVVGQLIPDYKRAEAWLKANGVGLMRYGAIASPPGDDGAIRDGAD